MTDNDDTCGYEKNVKIFVRILPRETCHCESYVKIDTDRKKICLRSLQQIQPNRIVTSEKPSYWCFRTDGIFCDSSQEEVFHASAQDLVTKILDGVNCVLLGYGQTGTGKSFTINGLRNNWEHRGLVPRLLSRMFAEKTNRKKVSQIEYRISFVELYGREARDLLVSDENNKIKINERDPFKDINVVYIDDERQGLRKIFDAEIRRSITKGSHYSTSHLATAVITFHVSNISLITSWGVVTTAKMHIVEAAGTGTAGRRSSCWKTATDIGMANLMKSELEQFFYYITSPRSSSINIIRSNNLLKILGSAFSLSSVIRFISHIQITKEDLDITLSTLKFTARVANLKPVKVRENVQYRADLLVYKLQNEVNDLKKELTLNDLFLQQEALVNISKSRIEQINRTILSYLDGKISDFTLFSVSQAQALLKTIKDLYNRLTVKEVEVEKLKETYENLIKDAPVIDRSLEIDQKDGEEQAADNHWLRLRSLSQILLEVKPLQQEMEKEEVGNLIERSGITLGPYTNDTIMRSVQTQSIVKIDDQHMGAARHLFGCFLKEDIMFNKIKEIFDKSQKTIASVHQKFTDTLDNYFQVKRNLDDALDKLSKHQEIRNVLKLENGKSELILEMEKSIEKDIQCHKKVLDSLKEELSLVQREVAELTRRQKEMGTKLESGFKDYCKRKNLLLHYTDKSMKAMLEPTDRESLEFVRRKYNKLQRKMLRKSTELDRNRSHIRIRYENSNFVPNKKIGQNAT